MEAYENMEDMLKNLGLIERVENIADKTVNKCLQDIIKIYANELRKKEARIMYLEGLLDGRKSKE